MQKIIGISEFGRDEPTGSIIISMVYAPDEVMEKIKLPTENNKEDIRKFVEDTASIKDVYFTIKKISAQDINVMNNEELGYCIVYNQLELLNCQKNFWKERTAVFSKEDFLKTAKLVNKPLSRKIHKEIANGMKMVICKTEDYDEQDNVFLPELKLELKAMRLAQLFCSYFMLKEHEGNKLVYGIDYDNINDFIGSNPLCPIIRHRVEEVIL